MLRDYYNNNYYYSLFRIVHISKELKSRFELVINFFLIELKELSDRDFPMKPIAKLLVCELHQPPHNLLAYKESLTVVTQKIYRLVFRNSLIASRQSSIFVNQLHS